LTVQNLTLIDGNAANITFDSATNNEPAGGAIFMRSGRLKVVNSRFFNNTAIAAHSDWGGGAIRVLRQYNAEPVYIVNSTFGGVSTKGNSAANGGALASIATSWTIVNSLFSHNSATGFGESSGNGGSGGAIYNDGNTMTLNICGSLLEYNHVNAQGSAIFFVSNDHSGNVVIADSTIRNNVGGTWYEMGYPAISGHADTAISVTNSSITQ
jgi:hypothetical protein